MKKDVLNRLVKLLPKGLLLDLTDMGVTKALQAHQIIREHTTLKGTRARGAEGQIRFRIMEQDFQEICEGYNGIALEGGLIEGSEKRTFQPFMRFGDANSPGIILGMASMPVKGELPAKNMSRSAGVSLNYKLTPRLPLSERDPQPGDIFVLFLVARDPARAGHVSEIATGIIDAEYQSFLFYESIENFMTRYALADRPAPSAESAFPAPLVRLKGKRKEFQPPESNNDNENKSEKDQEK